MKRTVLLIFLAFTMVISMFSQGLIRPNKPTLLLDGADGFITINELNAGFGLGGSTVPFSKNFFGFTSLNGYQVNENFMVGAGTGVLFFNDGPMIPLYVDMRLRFFIDDLTPFVSGSGGLLLNISDFDSGTRMFINPAVGVRVTMTRQLGILLSSGLWMQMGPNVGRASFINARLGVVYKF